MDGTSRKPLTLKQNPKRSNSTIEEKGIEEMKEGLSGNMGHQSKKIK